MHHQSTRRTKRTQAVITIGLVLMLILAACGNTAAVPETDVAAVAAPTESTSSEASDAAPTAVEAAPATLLSLGSVAPAIAPLGNLVSLHSDPVTQTFDANGGSLTLADGATIEVPAGSFPAPTEVTIVLANLRFDRYLDGAPEGRIYQLSTVEDVELGRPLFLDVPKASNSVAVAELTDNQWISEVSTSSQTTQIEITHFSTVVHSVVDRPECSSPENASMCEPGQSFGEWGKVATTTEVGDALIPIDLCGICPVRAAANSAELADTTDTPDTDPAELTESSEEESTGSTDQQPIPTVAPTPTPVPSSSDNSSSGGCESGYKRNSGGTCVSLNYNCNYPAIERHDAQSCMSRDLCGPASAGYKVVDNYRCTYQPTQNCQQGYTYYNGDCLTPQYNCSYPKLDHPRQNNCVTTSQCQGSGYSIQGTTCKYQQQQNCQNGYKYYDGKCRTPNFNCAYPKLDYPKDNGCINADQCQGSGFSIQGTTCKYQEQQQDCQNGYTYYDGKCRSPQYNCSYPNLDYPHRMNCISPSDCEGNNNVIQSTTCKYQEQQQNCQNGYSYSNGDCRSPQYNCSYPKLDYPHRGNCISPSDCEGNNDVIEGTTCRHTSS